MSAHYGYHYSPRYRAAYARLHAGRTPRRRHRRPKHPKLTIALHTASHLILGARPDWGPTNDAPALVPVMRQATAAYAAAVAAAPGFAERPRRQQRHAQRLHALVADAGYDGEQQHTVCREELGVRRTVIRFNRRTAGRRWPRTRYRRALRRRFPWRIYHRRQQVESAFSQHKRRLGAALTARTPTTQAEELILRVLTHNLMLLRRAHQFNKATVILRERAAGAVTEGPHRQYRRALRLVSTRPRRR